MAPADVLIEYVTVVSIDVHQNPAACAGIPGYHEVAPAVCVLHLGGAVTPVLGRAGRRVAVGTVGKVSVALHGPLISVSAHQCWRSHHHEAFPVARKRTVLHHVADLETSQVAPR